MVAYVTVVAQQEPSWIRRLPTGLTHGALKAPPALAQNHFSDLQRKPPSRVIQTLACASHTEDQVHPPSGHGAPTPRGRRGPGANTHCGPVSPPVLSESAEWAQRLTFSCLSLCG